MKRYAQIALLVIIAIISISCQKLDEAQRAAIDFNNSQALISQVLDRRFQLIRISPDNDNCFLFFSNGTIIKISGSIFPILNACDDKCWSISGNKTNIPIRYDDSGKAETPILSIGDSDLWAVDDILTRMSASPYLSGLNGMQEKGKTLKGLVIHPDKVVFIFSDNSSFSLSILQDDFYIVPSYYLNHLTEKEIAAEKVITESNDNCTSFIFFSDTHWANNYKHSPALIRHICDYSGISKVFFGGDVIYKHASTPQDALQEGLDFQESFSFLGPNFYCVYGNHDNNSEGQVNKTDQHLNEEQVISYLQSQMTVLDKKEDYNFYFDEPRSKTRFIGLDTGRYYRSQFRTNFAKTAGFLIEALQTVPEEWHIVVISHIFMATTKVDGENKVDFASYCDFPLLIMDMYNMRQSGRSTYKKEYVDYDFTNCKGHIDFCIGGHVHKDVLLFTDGGIPVVSVPTDSKNVSNKEEVKKGTITEQSVSIITMDYSSRKINLFSVGRGTDREISY